MKKKNWTRLAALAMTMVMLFALVGCGGTKKEEAPAKTETKTEAPAKTETPAKTEAPAKTETSWPERDITVIVPAAAGGGSDTLARLIIPFLEEEWGVKMVVENYDTSIDGTVALAEAKNDGYTLAMAQNTDYGLHIVCYEDLGVSLEDYAFTGGITTTPMILAASAESGIKTLDDLIERANAAPGKIVCTISGQTHLLESLMLEEATGIDITTITRSSGSESAQAIMGSNNDIGILAAKFGPQIVEYGGTILGIFTSERVEKFADFPTFAEQGYDLVDDVMRGWAFPAGTDPEIVAKVEATMKALCERDDFVQALSEGGEIAVFKDKASYDADLASYLDVAQAAYEQFPDAF